ncbi:MAG: hypothetical protein M1831_005130 [Alyxoria varia]|nr:MAG: hypothetical protein M1831_005130 [Alyxoria varia]
MAPFFTIILYISILTGPLSASSLANSRIHGLPQAVDHEAQLIVDDIRPLHRPSYMMQKRNVFPPQFIPAKISSRSATATKIIAQTKYKRQSDPSSPSSLPRPFDSNLGNNFTESSCPLFFSGFLNDEQFQDCRPVSMLLTTSSSFFATTKEKDQLKRVLDASCNAKRSKCANIMDSYAQQIQSAGGCISDFERGNPNVRQAYDGFVAYRAIYDAACRKSSESDNYCFTEAVMNKTSPTSSYIYYLPIGLPLPAGAMPACNACLRKTIMDYRQYASNATQPLSDTYGPAVKQINLNCGPEFVDPSIPSVSGASSKPFPSVLIVVALAIAVAGLW